jgi:hypothetical protein
MMPLRICRKACAVEKVENSTALQRRKKSFQHDRTNRITLAASSTCERLAYAIERQDWMMAMSGARLNLARFSPLGCAASAALPRALRAEQENCSECNPCQI